MGWIKLDRKLLENELWRQKPFSQGQAWVDLLLMASYDEHDAIINGEVVHLMPGDVVRTQKQFAERWGWSRSKVRNFFTTIITTKAATITTTNKRTAVHIENYAFYQGQRPANDTTDDTTKSQQKDTYKKYKEIKEVEEVDARAREGQARGGTNQPINVNTKAITSAPRSTPTTPTLKELHSFCSEHDLHVNVERFAEYYGSRGWKTSTGKPVTDWKRKLRDWSDADDENWKEEQRRKAAAEKGRREQAEREAKLEEEYQKEIEKRLAEKGRSGTGSLDELKIAVLRRV